MTIKKTFTNARFHWSNRRTREVRRIAPRMAWIGTCFSSLKSALFYLLDTAPREIGALTHTVNMS